MSQHLLNQWKEAKNAREAAERWQHLPEGFTYKGSSKSFRISIAHSRAPMLCRAGQQAEGGKNYWETEKLFNQAILTYLVWNWDEIYPHVLNILKEQEKESLVKCEEYIKEMQGLIAEAQGRGSADGPH